MKRIVSKIGDIYRATMPDATQKYFQYIANDMTMLNSNVIRVFKKKYPIDFKADLNEIVNDGVDFYTHVVIKWGVQMNLWEKIGKIKEVGKVQPLFRRSDDYGIKVGEKMTEISERWQVWKINETMKFVGKLEGENQKAEVGGVEPPDAVLERIWTGKLNMMYPGYDKTSILRYIPTKEGEMIKEIIKKSRESNSNI
jgi:hypothetical protein